MTELRQPNLFVDGSFNLRELGGYPTVDGRRVKRGLLYRSGQMSGLSDAGALRMKALGIRSIVDFRREHECVSRPTIWHIGSDTEYWTCGHDVLSGELAELARGADTTAEAMHGAMVSLYRELPHRHADSYRHMFNRLVEGQVPLLFNCAAGKDRTGVAAALILHILGVPPETILADYVLTNDADFSEFIGTEGRYCQLSPSASKPLFAADAAYLDAMYQELRDQFGGIDTYIEQALGLDAQKILTLRNTLLD